MIIQPEEYLKEHLYLTDKLEIKNADGTLKPETSAQKELREKKKNFLKTHVDNFPVKETYVKITVESPLTKKKKEIEGLITGGSLNLNSKSNIRRTGSLTLTPKSFLIADVTDYRNLLSINKQIFIEIGFKNFTTKFKKNDIFWFPQGVFIIKTATVTKNAQGISISLSLTDKMSLLNGECGGVFTAPVQFDSIDSYDRQGNKITERAEISTIIENLLQSFGGDKLALGDMKIEVPKQVKQVMKWGGIGPVGIKGEGLEGRQLERLPKDAEKYEGTIIQPGQDMGYIYSKFFYPGDLNASIGETVTSILDKIKNALGNYEYFYNKWGQFVFQEIPNHLNDEGSTSLESIVDKPGAKNPVIKVERAPREISYTFEKENLLTAYQINPHYDNIKNDFIIWGARKTQFGDIPIYYHLAIDEKPIMPKRGAPEYYLVQFYEDTSAVATKIKKPVIVEVNTKPDIGKLNTIYKVINKTSSIPVYYQYIYDDTKLEYKYVRLDSNNNILGYICIDSESDWREKLLLEGLVGKLKKDKPQSTETSNSTQAEKQEEENIYGNSNPYFSELFANWFLQKKYIKSNKQHIDGLNIYTSVALENPNENYLLDFIDPTDNDFLQQYSIKHIGRRTKTFVDNTINCLKSLDIDNFIFNIVSKFYASQIESELPAKESPGAQEPGWVWFNIESYAYDKLLPGGADNPAFRYMEGILYQYLTYNKTVNLTSMPIYYLEPNTRIRINSSDPQIMKMNGEYMITSISLPLAPGGTMTIQAQEALTRVFSEK